MSAPERLVQDQAVPEILRMDLEKARVHSEGRYDVALGLAALQGAIAGGAVVSGSSGGTGLGLKLILGTGVVAGVMFALWPSPEQPPEMSRQAGEPALVAPTPETPEPDVAIEPGEAPEAEVVEVKEPPAVPAQPGKTKSTPIDPDELMRQEIAHLKEVRAAAAKDPNQAVSLARAGHQKFAKGILYEEREGLLILSLQKLGSTGEATSRARRFSERFPKSPLLPKMQSLLGEAPE